MQDIGIQIKRLDLQDLDALLRCFSVFKFLRPHLDQAEFLRRVRVQMNEGFAIAYVESNDEIIAAAGYRIAHFLAWGKVLYVDDLITHPDKKRLGLGGALIDWLIAEGKSHLCDEIHLDTGFQRFDAHRLYLNKGFQLNCHHMARTLK
jgi:GNAT superfamily N-acetyltransferase